MTIFEPVHGCLPLIPLYRVPRVYIAVFNRRKGHVLCRVDFFLRLENKCHSIRSALSSFIDTGRNFNREWIAKWSLIKLVASQNVLKRLTINGV